MHLNINLNRPIFILGNPRSGTSLLRLMLHSHSEISIPPESHFFLWLEDKYKHWSSDCLDEFIEDLFASTKFETWNIEREALRAFLIAEKVLSYGQLISLIYAFYIQQEGQETTTYWGDKNSLWIEKLEVIKTHYPNAFFIHIVRDGRDVACSYKSLNKKIFDSPYAPKLPNQVVDIAQVWKTNVEAVDLFLLEKVKPTNKITIRYEDLINTPTEMITKILDKLALHIEQDQLNYFLKDSQDIEPLAFLKWKEKLKQPLDIKNIGKFKHELTNTDIASFNFIAKTTLRKYNYL
ncbi:sulfotransferase family protein [Bizionia sp.]|uniref:sulfotransferase family protein n=1 Tax=Bizionia sp. TaxID=1954480 RepID=UPI003A93D7B3